MFIVSIAYGEYTDYYERDLFTSQDERNAVTMFHILLHQIASVLDSGVGRSDPTISDVVVKIASRVRDHYTSSTPQLQLKYIKNDTIVDGATILRHSYIPDYHNGKVFTDHEDSNGLPIDRVGRYDIMAEEYFNH